MSRQSNLLEVDWSTIPAPPNDGATRHLSGKQISDVFLAATDGSRVCLSALSGRTVVYAYPMTGQPGMALPDGWDEVPGARGCTPQSCAFRDHYQDLIAAGARHVFGLSTQDTEYQREAAQRLHLPFPLLSDDKFELSSEIGLPTITLDSKMLLKRLALVINDGRITKVFYPVFPPDRNAADVLAWLRENPG